MNVSKLKMKLPKNCKMCIVEVEIKRLLGFIAGIMPIKYFRNVEPTNQNKVFYDKNNSNR